MTRCVALLRGINVGGKNQLAMADLRATIESLGFDNVTTHIQSGNVVFDGAPVAETGIGDQIAAVISEHHGLLVPVVVRTGDQMRRIAGAHPDAGSGIDPKLLHVMFLDRVPDRASVEDIDRERFLPDAFAVDGTEIYVRYPNGSARSKLTIQVFERALDATATGRNLNTVRALAALAATHP